MAYCPNCKKELPEGSGFCPVCGRTAEAPKNMEAVGMGRLTFFRQSCLTAKAVKTKIIVDGKTVAELREKQKISVSLPYGTHSVTMRAPLAPSYKTSVVLDANHRDVRCEFAINKRSGRPEPVLIPNGKAKRGTTYLQPKAPSKKWEWIQGIVLSLLFFALMAYASWQSNGRGMNVWTILLLLAAAAVAVLLVLKYRKAKLSRSTAAKRRESGMTQLPNDEMKQEPAKEQSAESAELSAKSIYQTILENLQEGELPQGFHIQCGDEKSSGVKFAPGAMDGILLYHTTPYAADEETQQQILQALQLISDEDNASNIPQIMDIFEKLESKSSIVKLYDTIVHVMLSNIQTLDPERLLRFGDFLISYGTRFMPVKMGLTLLSIFNDKIPFVKEVHLTLGAYEEFTWFAARYLSSGACEDGNQALFDLARHVHGWGRIHAVNCLEPETREISDWLLYEGAKNTVLPQYSADLCLMKAGAEERLNEGVSEAEFTAISFLLESALEKDGPCPGLGFSDAGLLPAYLRAAKQFPLNRDLIQSVRDWSKAWQLDPQIAETAEQLLQTSE